MDIKTKNKRDKEVMMKFVRSGREGGRAGRGLSSGNWKSGLMQFVGRLSLSLVPFLKYYTRGSHAHTHFLHCTAVVTACSEDRREKQGVNV